MSTYVSSNGPGSYSFMKWSSQQHSCSCLPQQCAPGNSSSPCCVPGPPGPGASAIFVPFSVDSVSVDGGHISTDAQGNPDIVDFAGFGGSTYYAVQLQPGDWAAGRITFTEYSNYGASFILPRNGILRNISVVFANRSPGGMYLDIGVIMRPFICLATLPANASQLVYSIVPGTMTFTEPYIGTGVGIPKYSLRWGNLEGLNIPLAQGTAVAIVLGWMGENVTSEQYTNASVSGSLYIE